MERSKWYMLIIVGLHGCFDVLLTLVCDGQRDTCEYNANLPHPSCYCDKQCFYFNDCCKEALQSNVSLVREDPNREQFCVPLTNEDKSWKEIMRKVQRLPNALRSSTGPGLLEVNALDNYVLAESVT